jgi:tetratricopeptide (TPR) repeat protein
MRTLAIALSLSALAAPAAAQDLNGDLAQVDDFWKHRDEAEAVKKGHDLISRAYEKNPENPDVLWRYARALWFKSDNQSDNATKEKLGAECWKIAEKSEKLSPKNAECPYAVGLCIGEYSLGLGIVQALWEGIEGKFKGAHERAIKLDEKVGDGGPFNSIGRMYYKMPWPKQDLKESLKWYKEALRVNPAGYRTMVFMAESYLEMKEPKEAKKWVDKILDQPAPGKDPYEEKKCQREALALRKQIEEALK